MNPVQIIRDARAQVDDRFAFGTLLRIELYLEGKTIYPSKFLPQSVHNVDLDRMPRERLTSLRYPYSGSKARAWRTGLRRVAIP